MKEAKYHALTVADYIIRYSIEKNFSVSNLKLQKILYFVQAQFLVAEDRPCFKEQIEAWTFGPVVPEVYYEYKFFGSSDINFVQKNIQENISSDDKKLIESIVKECVPYSASQLVRITYSQLPWKEAFVEYQNNPISAASLKKFFSE